MGDADSMDVDGESVSVEELINETVADDDDRKSDLSDDILCVAQTPTSDFSQLDTSSTGSIMEKEHGMITQLEDHGSGVPGDVTVGSCHGLSVGVDLNESFEIPPPLSLGENMFGMDIEPASSSQFTDPNLSEPTKEFVPEVVTVTSAWSDYLRDRVNRITYPLQKSVAERRRFLYEVVKEDHCYDTGKPSENRNLKSSTSTFIRSCKTLFHIDDQFSTISNGNTVDGDETDETVDIETCDPPAVINSPYDRERAISVMREMEEFMTEIRRAPDGTLPQNKFDEEYLKTYTRRGAWTSRQRALFDSCIKIFYQERCVRLSVINHPDEPIIRRLSLDRAASSFRKMMANIQWNGRLVYWLHAILIDGLNPPLLAIYFEILQTLVEKIPEHVNSLFTYMLPTPSGTASELLMKMLEHPWDPIGKSVFHFDLLPALCRNPLFILAPHPYGNGHEKLSFSRIRTIARFLTNLGSVVQVDAGSTEDYTPADLYKNMIITTRNTIVELQKVHPDQPLVLVGMGVGSLVACQTSLIEPCSAIICFGFPLKTPKGMHGEYGDPLLKLDASIQFFIGLNTYNCPIHEFLEFRDKLSCDTEVVCAAGCDDYLRMKHYAKQSLKMTQCMVDRCFLEEVVSFLHQALQKIKPGRKDSVLSDPNKKRKVKTGKESSSKKKTLSDIPPKLPVRMARKMQETFSESNTSSQDASTIGSSTPSSLDAVSIETPPLEESPVPPLPSIGTLQPIGTFVRKELQWYASPSLIRTSSPLSMDLPDIVPVSSGMPSFQGFYPRATGPRLSVITHTGQTIRGNILMAHDIPMQPGLSMSGAKSPFNQPLP